MEKHQRVVLSNIPIYTRRNWFKPGAIKDVMIIILLRHQLCINVQEVALDICYNSMFQDCIKARKAM